MNWEPRFALEEEILQTIEWLNTSGVEDSGRCHI
jgi:hypothetical protein